MDEGAGFAIRPATPSDAQAVADVYAYYVRHTAATFETVVRSADDWRATQSAATHAGWPFLVATLADDVVGFAYVAPWRPKPAYRYTVETTVYLRSGLGRRGYGRALTTRVLREAAANGAREVIAVVADTGDLSSQAMHAALGFTEAGRLRRVGFKFDRWIDVVLMQKSLDGNAP